ncbi:MAG: hypothetical protein P1U32_06750 [Legionellaceae bacterium]|nr:hypothetical protein [Legionellaceae bacterium]
MMKVLIVLLLFCLTTIGFANNTYEIIEQGVVHYYTDNDAHKFDVTGKPDSNIMLDEVSFGGKMIRAKTKCYFIQIDPSVHCPDYAIGHAAMKAGTPQDVVCNAAKKATVAPLGCQRKHCTLCTYDNP